MEEQHRDEKIMNRVRDKLDNAELVLIGIGEEMDLMKKLRTLPDYEKTISRLADQQMIPFVEKIMLQKHKTELIEGYQRLAECLGHKNYFIVSVTLDGLIEEAGFSKERIVLPCGGYKRLQCSRGCSPQLFAVPRELEEKLEAFCQESAQELWDIPSCPSCGQSLVFNNVHAHPYLEEGYLEQWQIYKKWLQGTINKSLCVIELGVGMQYPTVIRWPFEKIVFFNQKAELFRVHSRLYQISEEISARGHGIERNPWEFVKELSNER